MYNRDPRSYSYDDQASSYSSGHHTPHHSSDFSANSYHQNHSSDHYYAEPAHGIGDANSPGPYFRSMTPSIVSSNRYSTTRDPRYYSSQGYNNSSSSTSSHAVYPAQHPQYPSQYIPSSEHRSVPLSHAPHPQPQFIPTPSEIAQSYSNYPPHISSPHSPTASEGSYPPSSLDYSSPPHLLPSSHGSLAHHPRIVTGRPRTGSAANSTSPTSASSPTGERFPCEKCGKTFSRSHDRKRHHETQHLPTPIFHVCPYCSKEFSRNDSLKRHLDNGCEEMHS